METEDGDGDGSHYFTPRDVDDTCVAMRIPRMISLEPAEGNLRQAEVRPSEIMNHFGRKGGPQGVQHGEDVDDFLGDGAAHRT